MWARQRCAWVSVVYSHSISSAVFNLPTWATFSWSKIRDEQVMSKNEESFFTIHIKCFPLVRFQNNMKMMKMRKGTSYLHAHYSFPPYFCTTVQKNHNIKMNLCLLRSWSYPRFFTGSFVTECLKNYSSETFWLCYAGDMQVTSTKRGLSRILS